jgi:hypothetical protein
MNGVMHWPNGLGRATLYYLVTNKKVKNNPMQSSLRKFPEICPLTAIRYGTVITFENICQCHWVLLFITQLELHHTLNLTNQVMEMAMIDTITTKENFYGIVHFQRYCWRR